MEQKMTTYTPVTALDCAKEYGFETKTPAKDIALDLKFLLKDYYLATFDVSGKALNVNFENGQKIKLTVEEIKAKD